MARGKEKRQQQIVDDELTDDEASLSGDQVTFQDIDLLTDHGITSQDVKKLKVAGVYTIKGIQMMTKRKMIGIRGLSEAKVDKIREAVGKICSGGVFKTAFEVNVLRKQVFKISTGSSELDLILGGGIESMALTEVFGEFRCGKTQLAHTICISCQVPNDEGYAGGKAIFIDTENTFRPERLRSIAKRFNLDEDEALKNVIAARAYNSEQQYEILDVAAGQLHAANGAFKLIVIDSVMALFRVDFSGRGELADRQQKLAQFLARLQRLCEEFNTAAFLTNQMTADPGATMSFQADPKKPIGGHILAHASTTRIALRKGRGEQRIAKIYDSPDMPESEATFSITEGGISDAKDS